MTGPASRGIFAHRIQTEGGPAVAGTGHPYEVVNTGRVRETLEGFAARVPHPEGRAWFSYPHVLRFATSPAFVATVTGEEAEEAVAIHVADPAHRGPLLAKLAAGADLRLFVPRFFEHLGPDLGHVADWMAAMPAENPRGLRKLGRMTVPQAVAAADRWTSEVVRRAATSVPGEGRTEYFMAGRGGRAWWSLLDGAALEAESVAMNHCVRSYAPKLAWGNGIYSLRDATGASLVTLQTISSPDRPEVRQVAVGQIRAPWNKLPASFLRPDVQALLDRVGAKEDAYREAAALGMARDAAGRWLPMREMARRIELGGLHCWAYGTDVHALSPSDPETTLAVLSGHLSWWEGPTGRSVHMTVAGDRKLPLAAQRAVARLAQAVPDCQPGGVPWLVRKDGEWMPWADACEVLEFEGAAVLHHDGTYHVPRASDRGEILAVVERVATGGHRPGTKLVARPAGPRQWSVEDVRTVAAALDGLRVDELAKEDEGLRKAGLDSPESGRWARFADHAAEYPCLAPAPDGRPRRWVSAPWKTVLRLHDGRETMSIHAGMDGRVRHVIDYWASTEEIRDAARLLNELGRGASSWFLGDSITGMRWRRTTKEEGEGAPRVALGYGDGRWFVAEELSEVLAHLRSAGRRQFRDPDCTSVAMRLLPPSGTDPEVDLLLARHLAAWAKATPPDLIAAMRTTIFSGHRSKDVPRQCSVERLAEAGRLLHLMTPPERRAVGRAAAHLMRSMRDRKRNGGFAFMYEAQVREMTFALREALPESFMEFAVPRLLRLCGRLLTETVRGKDGQPDPQRLPETRWMDLFDGLDVRCRKARGAIVRAASDTLWMSDRTKGQGVRCDAATMEQWLRMVRIAMLGGFRFALQRGLEGLMLEAEAMTAAGDPAGPGFAARIAELQEEAAPKPRSAFFEWPPIQAIAA